MQGTGWPAILKRSIRGTQFFAHAPGFPGQLPEPESEPHRLAKRAIAEALRAAGYFAVVEFPGETKEGEPWQADVLCRADGRTIAFEVQLSPQTLEEFENRTARYRRSDVKVVWLVKHPQMTKLNRAIWHRYQKAGQPAPLQPVRSLWKLPLMPFTPGDPKKPSIDDMRVQVFPFTGSPAGKQIELGAFAVGVAAGELSYSEGVWCWGRRHLNAGAGLQLSLMKE